MPGPHVSFTALPPAESVRPAIAESAPTDQAIAKPIVVAVSEVDWPITATVHATLIAAGICFVSLVIVWHRQLALLLFGGIVLATSVQPIIAILETRCRLSRAHSAVVVFFLFVLLLGASIVAMVPEVSVQAGAFWEKLPGWYDQARDFLQSSPNRSLKSLGAWIPVNMPQIWNLGFLSAGLSSGSESPLAVVWKTLEGALGLLAVGVLAFYWSLNQELTIRSILQLAPDHRREFYQSIVDELLLKLGGYIRGQLILCAAVGILSLIAYLCIGLPYSLMLALIAGVLEAVPIIGPTLGAVPAILVALSLGPQQTVLVIGSAMLIQTLENYLLVPKIMDRSVGLGAVVTLLAIVACGALFGVIGAVFAIPLAAVSQTLFERLVLQADFKTQEFTARRDAAGVLHYQLQDLISDVKRQQRQKDTPVDNWTTESFAEIETLAVALDELVRDEFEEEPTPVPVAKVTVT